jgi:hypothetical protein
VNRALALAIVTARVTGATVVAPWNSFHRATPAEGTR